MPDLTRAISRGRAVAQELMQDSCIITRPATTSTTDPVTGVVTRDPGPTLYRGKCRVQIESAIESQADSGEARYQLLSVLVSVPISRTVYRQGDLVTITRSKYDPALAGREYKVQAVVSKTHATARRLRCEEGV